LESKSTQSTIIYTGSNLSIIPAVTLSGYSASKAALNSFVLCLRQELAHAKSAVEIVEISPPVVQTELHDYAGPKGKQMGMPVEEFIDIAYKGLVSGSDQIVIGDIGGAARFNSIIDERRAVFEGLAKILQSH
jgi:short-subunit dehydrogenase